MWVILFALVATGLCACPNGYADDGTGVCVSPFKTTNKQFLAYNNCAKDNAYLDIVTSSAANTQLQTRIGVANYAWLGLTCTTNATTSCVWDNGTPIKGGDFVNFKNGIPTPLVGACVALSGSDGKWYSKDCTMFNAIYRCAISTGAPVKYCTDGSAYFRGNCYFGILANDENSAAQRCTQDCANLASIHSDGENSIVRDVSSLLEPTKFSMLGLTGSSSYYRWGDYSSSDYYNFGYQNDQMGQCVSMALTGDFVDPGQWVSSSCNPTTYFNTVCKKNVTNTCDISSTSSPAVCGKALFLSNAGVLYSPSYPGKSGPNTCEYVITQKNGYNASITFTNINIDMSSSLQFFNSIYDTTPFTAIVGSNRSQTITSNQNSLVVQFKTNGNGSNYFRAEYGIAGYPLCNNGELYDKANFTSPNYPDPYPMNSICEFRLKSSKNRIALVFDDFYTGYYDSVTVYDGNGATVEQLSQGPYTGFALSSFTQTLRVVFSTGNYNPQRGFRARFISTY